MDLYRTFDYISGIGCIIYAMAFIFKKMCSSTERKLIFFYTIMGLGFIFRGLSMTFQSEQFALLERFFFIPLSLAITLYIEKIARITLGFRFKFFVLFGCFFNYLIFFVLPRDHSIYFFKSLLVYEVSVLSYLSCKLFEKVYRGNCGVERSICISLLLFSCISIVLLLVDWHLAMDLGKDRITSIIVFPVCFITFMISYSPESYSLKSVLRILASDLFFLFVIVTLVFLISKDATPPSMLTFLTVSLYVKMIFKTFNVVYNSSEKKKSKLFLAQVTRLGRMKVNHLITQGNIIDNVSNIRVLNKEDFEKESLSDAYKELSKGELSFSRIAVESAKMGLEDDVDRDLIYLMEYSLDAFLSDFIYFVPNTNLCVSIKFEGLNLDSSLENKAHAIFTQVTMSLYREGMAHV